jgi:RHS repeat-associated protein
VNTLSSAGGVGALLQIADHPTAQTYLPTYDGNGNVVALVNATSGAVAAAYEYSPFGEPLRAQTLDPVVADNPFRFSTKYTDGETGFVYYGRRFYSPSQGRFLGRDPIEEAGGLNLYGFVSNDPINDWDVLGCDGVTEHQSVAADGTRFMSYMASVTDVLGQLRQWNFSSEADAHNWLNAWATKDAGILKPYIQQMANEAFATPANITVQFLQTIPGISNTLRSLYPTLVGASDDDSDDAFFSRVISTIDPVLIYAQITGGRNPVVLDTLTVGFKGAQFLGGWNGDNDAFVNWVHQLPGQIIYDSPVILPGNVGAANRRIREFLKINPIGRINIIGYSAGGEQAVQLVTALAAQKIPVGTLITIDPHFRRSGSDDANFSIPTGAVAQALNFFQRNPLGTYNKYLGSAVKGADNFDLTGLRPNGPGDSLVEHSDIVRFLLTPGGYPGYMNYQLAIYNALGLPPPPRR